MITLDKPPGLPHRLLADRVAYARQASVGDSISLYPAAFTKPTAKYASDGSSVVDAVQALVRNEASQKEKPKGKKVPAKKVSVKKVIGAPLIEKWNSARAELEVNPPSQRSRSISALSPCAVFICVQDYAARNKKETEMTAQELAEATQQTPHSRRHSHMHSKVVTRLQARERNSIEWRAAQEAQQRCHSPVPVSLSLPSASVIALLGLFLLETPSIQTRFGSIMRSTC